MKESKSMPKIDSVIDTIPSEAKAVWMQILGLQRSGTNYLQRLITDNFSIDCTGRYFPIWKHLFEPDITMKHYGESFCEDVKYNIDFLKSNCKTILISKNPYFWLESVKRKPVDADDLDWDTFRPDSSTKDTVKLGFLGDMDLEKICRMWADFHEYWLTNSWENLVFIKYEDLLVDPVVQLNMINKKLSLCKEKTVTKELINIPHKVAESKDFKHDRISKYISQSEPNITNREKEVMTSVLSPRILQFYNYQTI